MQHDGLETPPRRARTRAGSRSDAEGMTRFKGLLSLAAAVVLVGLAPQSAAHADGGLETQKGGLFHRKGWIAPDIYKRRDEKAKSSSTASAAAPAGRVGASKSTPAKRTASRRRTRKPTVSTPRVPSRIVKRREHAITRSARRSKPAPATSTTQVASLTTSVPPSTTSPATPTPAPVTGGGARIHWLASSRCLAPRLRAAIGHVASNYGRVRVNSTCRSRKSNRRAGGARHSYHLKGQAADLRVFGNIRAAARYFRKVAGGYKHYGGGLFHIDTGPKRSW